MKVFDTHSHILLKSFEDELDDVIEKIKQENIIVMNISYDLISSQETIDLYKKNNDFFPVVGIHPVDANDSKEEDLVELENLIKNNLDSIKAIGEIGLDYFHEFKREKQIDFFIKQIELAIKYELPVVIHTRDSLEDCYEVIKNYPNQKFLLHSWSGDLELTKKYLDISDNIYFSFNGVITFKNAPLPNETINIIPIEKIMFETDCPFLSPVPYRGQTNFPWRVKEVIEYCSNKLGLTFEELNNINNANALKFFNINEGDIEW